MARKEREFGNKQSDMLDDVTARLLDIDANALLGQEAIKRGDSMTAFIEFGDIRNLSLEAREAIGKARRGIYEDRK